jgi:hypothetical protein
MPWRRFAAALVAALAAACTTTPPAEPAASFSFLATSGSAIVTRHSIPLRVEADPAFRVTAPSDRVARFDEHPYQVSLAALLGEREAVMVHAERVADSSGASNYDSLPAADWPDSRFRLRSMCAPIDAASVDQEHDLGFLRRNGWNPEGQLALEQYLATTPDHNQEVVISLVVHVSDCGRTQEVESALRTLRSKVRVTPR